MTGDLHELESRLRGGLSSLANDAPLGGGAEPLARRRIVARRRARLAVAGFAAAIALVAGGALLVLAVGDEPRTQVSTDPDDEPESTDPPDDGPGADEPETEAWDPEAFRERGASLAVSLGDRIAAVDGDAAVVATVSAVPVDAARRVQQLAVAGDAPCSGSRRLNAGRTRARAAAPCSGWRPEDLRSRSPTASRSL